MFYVYHTHACAFIHPCSHSCSPARLLTDEVAMIRLSLPGVWPSYGGGMWSTITILDDGDGVNVSPLASYSQKIHIGADSPGYVCIKSKQHKTKQTKNRQKR